MLAVESHYRLTQVHWHMQVPAVDTSSSACSTRTFRRTEGGIFTYSDLLPTVAIYCRRNIVPLSPDLHLDCERRASLKKRGTRRVWNACCPCSAQCWVAKQSRQEVGSTWLRKARRMEVILTSSVCEPLVSSSSAGVCTADSQLQRRETVFPQTTERFRVIDVAFCMITSQALFFCLFKSQRKLHGGMPTTCTSQNLTTTGSGELCCTVTQLH